MKKESETTQAFRAAQQRLLEWAGVAAESRFLEIPSVSSPVHVLTSGEGPPVVLVPGFGDPAAMWIPLMAELGGFRLYAVDRPSFGLSGSAPHTTATFRRLGIQFLEQVLDGLELERPAFIGNSIGSLWSIWLALDRPGRVAAMAHLGCPAFLLGTSAPLPMRLLSIPPVGRLMMRMSPPSPKQVEQFADMVGEDLSALPEIRDMLVEMQKLPGVRPALLELLHAVIRLRGPRPELVLTAHEIEQISQPVQLIWGGRDPFGPPDVGEQAAAIIPDAEFHLIPWAGHVPWFAHAPQAGELVVAFLRASSLAH